MGQIWKKSRRQYNYKYDSNRDLYEQIESHINEKLDWYRELFPNSKIYAKETIDNLSLNRKYALITTINIGYANIEKRIKNSITEDEKERTFNIIMWHIPQYVLGNLANPKEKDDEYIPTYHLKPIKNECIIKEEINNIWDESDVFGIEGRLLNPVNIEFKVNNSKVSPLLSYKNFKYVGFEKPVSLKNFINNNNDLLSIKLSCTKDTVENCDNLFMNNSNLLECDLSNINLNYCKSFKNMFCDCSQLRKIDLSNLDLDISDPDTTNMFRRCFSLHNIICKNCSNSTIWQLKCILSQYGLNVTITK